MKRPPKWLMTCVIAEDNNYNKNLEDWIYRGDYWEAPETLICTHVNPDIKSSGVKMFHIAYNNKDLHGIGQCADCGKVLWFKIVPR